MFKLYKLLPKTASLTRKRGYVKAMRSGCKSLNTRMLSEDLCARLSKSMSVAQYCSRFLSFMAYIQLLAKFISVYRKSLKVRFCFFSKRVFSLSLSLTHAVWGVLIDYIDLEATRG